MLNLFPTETVTVLVASYGEPNKIGERPLILTPHEVAGCLVQPYNTADQTAPGFENRDTVAITVHLPKSFKQSVANARVMWRGRTWLVVGDAVPDSFSPLSWNRGVICEVDKL